MISLFWSYPLIERGLFSLIFLRKSNTHQFVWPFVPLLLSMYISSPWLHYTYLWKIWKMHQWKCELKYFPVKITKPNWFILFLNKNNPSTGSLSAFVLYILCLAIACGALVWLIPKSMWLAYCLIVQLSQGYLFLFQWFHGSFMLVSLLFLLFNPPLFVR